MFQRKLILSSLLLFAALATGGAVVLSRAPAPAPEPSTAAPAAVPVIAATVKSGDVPIVLTGLGTVTALNTATVRSQVTGLLVDVPFKEGQFVKKGDLLGKIDPRTYEAQVDVRGA